MPGKFDADAFSTGDVMREIKDLKRRIAGLETARRLEAASIGRGGTTVRDGLIRAVNAQGEPVAWLGTLAEEEFPGFGGLHTWVFYDNSGEFLVAPDHGGVGLDRPNLEVPLRPDFNAEFTGTGGAGAWPSTTSTTPVALLTAEPHLMHGRFAYWIVTTSDGGTSNWNIKIGGAVAATGTGTAADFVDVPGWGTDIRPGDLVKVEVEGWISGAGTRTWMQVFRFSGLGKG